MSRPLVDAFPEHLSQLEAFISSEDANLCILTGESGHGKSTLLKQLQKTQKHGSICSFFHDEFSDFYTQIVWDLTSLIIKHEELVGYRWKHILGESSIPMKTLLQIDTRLKNIVDQERHEQIDDASDRQTVLRRACKELFLLCSQNLPFQLLWTIDSFEKATESDITFIIDILEDPRGSDIKTVIALTSDSPFRIKHRRFERIEHRIIHLQPLSNEQAKNFLGTYLGRENYSEIEKIVKVAGGNISRLLAGILESNASISNNSDSELLTGLRKKLESIDKGTIISCTASLLGMKFYTNDLMALFSNNKKDVVLVLDLLVDNNIISRFSDYFIFNSSENRIELANLLTLPQRKQIRDRIAYHFYKLKTDSRLNIKWKVIAEHLSNGVNDNTSLILRKEQLSIYVKACKEASLIGEYSRIKKYCDIAISQISQNDWNNDRHLALSLYKISAKANYIAGDIELMEAQTDAIMHNSSNKSEDYFDAYQIKIEGYVAKNLLDEAISTAKSALKDLNVKFPQKVGRFKAAFYILLLLAVFYKTNISKIKIASNSKVKRVGRFLSFLSYAAYAKDENLSAYAISSGLLYSIRNGLLPETAYGMSFWSSGIIAGFLKNIRTAIKYSKLARKINALTSSIYKSRMDFLYNAFIGYHVEPLKENVLSLSQDVENCLNDGVINFASYAAHVACFHEFDTDSSIDKIKSNVDRYIYSLRGYSSQNPDLWIKILRQLLEDISQPEFPESTNEGRYFSYQRDIDSTAYEQNMAAVFIANHYAVVRHLLSGNYANAFENVNLSYKYVHYVRGTYGEMLALFINAAFITYKSQTKRLSLTDKMRLRYTLSLFKHLAKQRSRVALEKLQAIEFFYLFSRKKEKEAYIALEKSIAISESSGHVLDTIILCRMAFDLFPQQPTTTYLKKAISLAQTWAAPAVENSLRIALGKHDNSCYFSNPSGAEESTSRYLIRCINILNTSYSDEAKCLKIAEEIRMMVGALDCSWLDQSNNQSAQTQDNNLSVSVRNAFNERKPIEHISLNDAERSGKYIIFPVQTPSMNFGAFVMHVEPDTLVSVTSYEAIRSITHSLAKSFSTNTLLVSKKYLSTINNSLYEKAAEGLLVATISGEIVQYNKRFLEILDLNSVKYSIDLQGIKNSLNISDRELIEIKSVIKGNKTECQISALTLNNRHILIALKSDERFIYCCISDITDTIRKTEQDQIMLRQAVYFASAVHEIRNPLNTLLGFSNIAVRDDIPTEQKDHYAKIVNTTLSVLIDILNDLISITAISEGKFPIRKSIFEAKEIFSKIKATYTESAALRGISLELNCQDNLKINSDCDRLCQVLRNMISNAIKYSECSTISISLSAVAQDLIIIVADNGTGIPAEKVETIFSPFSRVGSINEDGSGLGLYICSQIVEQLGGTITYQDPQGGGAKFTIKIPRSISETLEKITLDKKTPNSVNIPTGLRVFVIDDDPLNNLLIEREMEYHSVEVVTFGVYEDALQHLKKDADFDLIISDLHIGRHSGFDFIEAARKLVKPHKCAYALVTGDTKHDVQRRCSAEQIFYISKPVNNSTLLELVQKSYSISTRITSEQSALDKPAIEKDNKESLNSPTLLLEGKKSYLKELISCKEFKYLNKSEILRCIENSPNGFEISIVRFKPTYYDTLFHNDNLFHSWDFQKKKAFLHQLATHAKTIGCNKIELLANQCEEKMANAQAIDNNISDIKFEMEQAAEDIIKIAKAIEAKKMKKNHTTEIASPKELEDFHEYLRKGSMKCQNLLPKVCARFDHINLEKSKFLKDAVSSGDYKNAYNTLTELIQSVNA